METARAVFLSHQQVQQSTQLILKAETKKFSHEKLEGWMIF